MRFSIFLILSLFTCSSLSQENLIQKENELVPFKVKDKWGAATVEGELKISAKYDELEPFFHNVTRVMKDDKQGVINTKQKVVVPLIYDEVEQMIYSKNGEISYICNKDEKVMLQIGKKVIVPLSDGYENIYAFVDSNHTESYFVLSKKKGTVFQFDLINSKGDKIIENAIGDDLRIISIDNSIEHDYGMYANLYNAFAFTKKIPETYWWSEAEKAIDFSGDIESVIEEYGNGYDNYGDYGGYGKDKFHIDDYNKVDNFKSTFIKLVKKQSRNSVARAFYTIGGSEVFNFGDKVEKLASLNEELVIVKTYDDDLNCKKPTKYGIYNLKKGSYTYKPLYGFFKKQLITKDIFSPIKDQIKQMEMMCENIEEIKEIFKNEKSKEVASLKILKYLGIEKVEPEYLIALANESDIKIIDLEGKILTESIISEGVFIPDDYFKIHTKDSIYVGIEVFNDTYRGKGIKHVNTGDIVVMPIYEEISGSYGNNITLSGSEMATLRIDDFNFPINSITANIGKDFVRALSNNIYVVSKDKEQVAVYNVKKKKNITKYNFPFEEEYPKIRVINENEYIFLKDSEDNYSVIDANGNVLVPSSEEEIEVEDIYGNNKIYFITIEGYYGIDGTKYFK